MTELLLTHIWSAVSHMTWVTPNSHLVIFPYDWVTPDSHQVSCFPMWLSYSWLTSGHLFSHMTRLLLTHIKSAVFHMTRSYSWLTSGHLFSQMTLTWVTPDSYQVITFPRRLLFPIWCHLTSISAIFMKRTILQTIRSWHFTKIKYTIIHVLNTSD